MTEGAFNCGFKIIFSYSHYEFCFTAVFLNFPIEDTIYYAAELRVSGLVAWTVWEFMVTAGSRVEFFHIRTQLGYLWLWLLTINENDQ